MTAGGGDDLTIKADLEGDLDRRLAELESRLESTQRELRELGRAGDEAGDKVAKGADRATTGLDKAERAADDLADSITGLDSRTKSFTTSADKLGDKLDSQARATAKADAAAEELDGTITGLDTRTKSFTTSAGRAARGADELGDELAETAAEAKLAARALDDAGDEAAESGVKAATAATLWERLNNRIARSERVTKLAARAQALMKWETYRAQLDRAAAAGKRFADIPWDKSAKRLDKMSKSFGGLTKVMSVAKITAIVGAVYALLGVISALGAGAVGAIGGIGSMVGGLVALGPVALSAVLALKGVTAAMKEAQPETKALKDQFQGFSTNIAAGGLRKGLQGLARDTKELSRLTNTLGTYIGQSAKITLAAAGTYAKSSGFLQKFGVIADGTRTQVTDLGLTGVGALRALVTTMAGASPVANRLTTDLLNLVTAFANNLDGLYESGRMTDYLNNAYTNLTRGLGILTDWLVGVYNLFKIGAQESRWMADSLEESATKFRVWTQSAEGENSIRKYFQDAMPAVRETGLLLRDLIVGLGGIAASEDVAPLINQIRTQLLPALLTLAGSISADILPGLVALATNLARLFAGLDMSGLTALLDGLNAFVASLLWASENIPGFNLVLSMILTTLFLLGPAFWIFSKGAKLMGGMTSAATWLRGALTGVAAEGTKLTFMQRVFGGIAGGLWSAVKWVGSGLWGLIGMLKGPLVQAAMWAGRMLAAAFLGSNPIGWIILAVIAVVGALWWLWENCETFREGVKTALAAVGDFFMWLGGKIMEGLAWLGDFFSGLWNGAVDAFMWLGTSIANIWTSYINPVLDAIGTGLKWVGAIIFTILVAPFVLAFNLLAELFTWFWQTVTWPILQNIGRDFQWLFNNIIMPVVNFFVDAWNIAMAGLAYAYYGYVLPFLTVMGEFFSWLFTVVIMGVVNFFVDAWNLAMLALAYAYYNYVLPFLTAMGALFDVIVNSVIMPVVDWLRSRWDLAMLGLQLAYQMYVVPMMNAFGFILNWLWSSVVNPILQWIQDRWNALGALFQVVYATVIQPAFDAVGTGLGWLRDNFNNMVGNIIEIWNRLRGGLAAPVNFIIGTIWNKGIMPTWNWIAEKLGLPKADPMAEIPAFATGGSVRGKGTGTSDDIPAMLSNGEHVWTAREVRQVGGHNQVERLRRMAASGALRFYAEGGPVTPQQMHSTVAAVLPGTRLSSGFRQGDPGFHGRNRAADLAGPRSMDTAFMRRIDEFIGTKFPGSSELIHTPGPFNIKNGRPHTYSAGIRQDHYDHVHWANNGAAAGEGGEGGIMTSFWDSIAKPALDAIINPVLSNIPFAGPPEFMNVPRKSGEKFRDDIYGWARGKFAAFDDFTGGIADSVSALAAQAQVRAAAVPFGWAIGPQWDAIMKLVQGESGWDPTAANPTSSARGLFQKMTSLHGPVETTAFGQGMWGLNYIKGAYGTPVNAYAKWSSRQPHWYDDGGYLPTGPSLVMNGTGSPEPVFTSGQWDILQGSMVNSDALVSTMLATPQNHAAAEASAREAHMDYLAGAVDRLAMVLDERAPAMAVSGGENTKQAVLDALAEHERAKRQRDKYRY